MTTWPDDVIADFADRFVDAPDEMDITAPEGVGDEIDATDEEPDLEADADD